MLKIRLCTTLLIVMAAPAFCQDATPAASAPPPGARPEGPAHVHGPVSPPVLLHSVDPSYSPEARAKGISGTVHVYLWVDEHGNASHVRVVKGVGMGLDEKAIEAVRQYKFKPAMMDGQPVKVDLYIEMKFQIQ